MSPARPLAGALAALAIAVAALAAARTAVGELLTGPGAPASQRPLAGAGQPAPPLARAPVRVVVLDGLSRAEAHGPALDALCARGLDLEIDVGFPTKSLVVQSVLWTGLTAQQTGVAMRNQLPAPVPGALPARVAGARAVVEAWTSIARGVGFTAVEPAVVADGAAPGAVPAAVAAWRAGFAAAAAAAVASDAPLVLVHVLAIDEAGHRTGRDATYRAAVARADALLAALVARAPAAHWVVTADHGHLAGGGHGDAEPEVRLVRGCVAPRPPGAPAAGRVHLVDLGRHLHDALGLAPAPAAVGRPLAVAARHDDRDATLPRVRRGAWLAAALVALAGLAAALRWGRPRAAACAPLVVAAAYAILCGAPSLSSRRPGVALGLGAVAAALVLLPAARRHTARVTALLLPATAAAVAVAILAGVPAALVGGGGPPARLPAVTAWWQVVVAAATPAWLVGAALLGAVVSGGRTSGKRTATSGGSDQAVRGPDSLG